MDVILLLNGCQHVVALRGHRKVGEDKNTGTNKMCLDHSLV